MCINFMAQQLHSCATVAAHKSGERSSPIMKTVNQATGKESTKGTNFNQSHWGTVTNEYLSSIKKNLSDDQKFDRIIKDAMHFSKASNRCGESSLSAPGNHEMANLNERALLVDDDSD
jgi:hypothetical protein